MGDARPDVLLVVMDCVRQDVFEAELARGALPFLESIRGQFVRFDRAVAPASWTIPSHASLFTGLYPWDHGAHYKAGALLGPGPATIAEIARAAGYRTACFSANGYVQPGTGLTRGFDEALWGGDTEFFLRFLARTASCPTLNGAGAAVHAILDRPSSASPLRLGTMRALSRFTPACDALNRLGGRIFGVPPSHVGEWIEASIARALAGLGGAPAFFFVNLLEAHEPYFADAGRPIGLGPWLDYARTTQVSEQWKTGEAVPTPRDLRWARRDYAATLRVLDERIRAIAARWQAGGRWDDALVILTSDHGQAFGEGGSMYHRLTLQEPITRIPLWVKPPRAGRPPGPEPSTWVSLTDVPATVAEAIGVPARIGDADACSLLGRLPGADRTVYSMTDGVSRTEAARLPEVRRRALDRVQVAAYRDGLKTIVDQSGLEYRIALDRGAASLVPGTPDEDPSLANELLARLRTVLNLPEPTSVSQRIAGWGY